MQPCGRPPTTLNALCNVLTTEQQRALDLGGHAIQAGGLQAPSTSTQQVQRHMRSDYLSEDQWKCLWWWGQLERAVGKWSISGRAWLLKNGIIAIPPGSQLWLAGEASLQKVTITGKFLLSVIRACL